MSFYLFLFLVFVLLARPQDFFPVLEPLRLALAMTALVTVTTLSKNSGRTGSIVGAPASRWYLVFFLTMALGVPFAYHRRIAFDFVILVYLSNMLFYFLFLANVDTLRKLQTTMLTICISTLFYAVSALRNGELIEGRFYAGGMFDPNDLAYFFLSLFPMSILLLFGNARLGGRLLGVIVICLSIGVVLLTGSRGGMVGLLAVFVLMILRKWPGVSKSSKALLVLIPLVVLAFSQGSINADRYLSLFDVAEDYNVTGKSGRLGIWREGLVLVARNPLTGVGVQCFPKALGEMRFVEGELPEWKATHNSYLQILTEVGIVGFVAFCAVILRCLRDLSRCRTLSFSVPGKEQLVIIAGSVEVAFVGSLITAFFLSQGYSIFFTLFFALSCSISRICDEQASDGSAVEMAQ